MLLHGFAVVERDSAAPRSAGSTTLACPRTASPQGRGPILVPSGGLSAVRRSALGPGAKSPAARHSKVARGAGAVVMPTGAGDNPDQAAAWSAGVRLRPCVVCGRNLRPPRRYGQHAVTRDRSAGRRGARRAGRQRSRQQQYLGRRRTAIRPPRPKWSNRRGPAGRLVSPRARRSTRPSHGKADGGTN